NNGWSVLVGSDGSLFFSLHDGTTQKFTDTDGFGGSPETDIVCVNQGDGTIKVYDKDNVEIGSSSTDIGTITYTGINFALGNRGEQVSTFNLNGYIVMAAVFNSALDEVQRANVLESLSPQIQKSLNVPATALSAFNTE